MSQTALKDGKGLPAERVMSGRDADALDVSSIQPRSMLVVGSSVYTSTSSRTLHQRRLQHFSRFFPAPLDGLCTAIGYPHLNTLMCGRSHASSLLWE